MRKGLMFALASLLLFSSACSSDNSSSDASPSNNPASDASPSVNQDISSENGSKEKEVIEVHLTKENFLDYFEIYEEPFTMTGTDDADLVDQDPQHYYPNDMLEEQFRNSEIPTGFATMIKLKDEFVNQLDFYDSNRLELSYITSTFLYKINGDGTKKEYGDRATAEEYCELFDDPEISQQDLLEMLEEQGRITDDGYYVNPNSIDKEDSISLIDHELCDGQILYIEKFFYIKKSEGAASMDLVSEGPRLISITDPVEYSSVSGTLYLHQ